VTSRTLQSNAFHSCIHCIHFGHYDITKRNKLRCDVIEVPCTSSYLEFFSTSRLIREQCLKLGRDKLSQKLNMSSLVFIIGVAQLVKLLAV
jgi:hypothetical protein